MRGDLRAEGPVGAVDACLVALRYGGASVALPAMAGGLLACVPVLLAFYLERVEGVHSLRPLVGVLLVLGFWARALLGARAVRHAILGLWPTLELDADGGRAVDVVRTASVVAAGLSVYLFAFAGAHAIWPGLVFFVLPVLVLRGLVAPAWIAQAATRDAGGVAVFLAAAGDNAGRRVRGVLTEALVLAGTLALALNLYAALGLGLLLLRSLLGLDLASLDAFMSIRNPLVGAGILTAAFAVFEPLRVCLAASAYVDVRVRQRGLDLEAAIEDAVAATEGPRRGGSRWGGGPEGGTGASGTRARTGHLAVGLVLGGLLSVLSASGTARAQVDVPPATMSGPLAVDPAHGADPADALSDAADAAARGRAREILARPEFVELEGPEGRDIGRLLALLLDWLVHHQPEMDLDVGSGFALPMPPTAAFLAAGAVLLLLVALYLFLNWRAVPRKAGEPIPLAEDSQDPRERAPEAHLDDAAGLASAGEFREALRSLYLATLVALDRRRVITFDPARTNWHYLKQLPRNARRGDFSRFTRLFDHKWYGDEATTRVDYDECRALADRIVAPGEAP